MGSKTGFLPKRVGQKHIFDHSQALGAYKGQKRAKIGPKGGPKHKIAYYEAKWDFKVPKMHSWVVKLVFYLKESARSILSITGRL